MLTDTAIRKLKPADKPQRVFDGGGLYLEVSPAGGKLWRLKYRFNGKEKRLALGAYPDTSLADARDRRNDARKLLASGVDPGEVKKAAKAEVARAATMVVDTFEAVARDWLARQEGAEVTLRKSRWILETCLFPEIGSTPVTEVTPRALLEALRKVEATGKLETAKRARIKAGQVFRWAILEGKAEADPTVSLRGALKAPKNKHHAAITDPVRIGELLRAIDGFTGQPVTLAALKLAPLVFVRPGELRQAEWTEFDLDGAIWRIPGERMKMKAAHIVPLSMQAVAILRELQPFTGEGRYVFPGLRTINRPMSENTVNAALRRLGYGTDEMTGHGFRSMAASRLNEMGWNADAIERQLAHAESNKVREAYTHAAQYLDERKRMMTAWADYLDQLRNGQDKPVPADKGVGKAAATPIVAQPVEQHPSDEDGQQVSTLQRGGIPLRHKPWLRNQGAQKAAPEPEEAQRVVPRASVDSNRQPLDMSQGKKLSERHKPWLRKDS